MKTSVLIFVGVIFLALIAGFYFTASDSQLPTVSQVTNPEASVKTVTSDKAFPLFLLVVGVPVLIGATAVPLAFTVWLLNRQVVVAQQQEKLPFDMLSFSTEGNTTGAFLINNVLYLVVGVGALMVLGAVLALLLL